MSKLIAFSGACHSGKSTMIRKIAERTNYNGIITLTDVIRDKVSDIDAIRKSPKQYLELQIEIITEKFNAETDAIKKHPNSIVLTDRSLADSFFYYIFYVDKSTLSPQQLEKYAAFFKWLYFRTLTTARTYDHIFLFRPLVQKDTSDTMRPDHLHLLQDVEFLFIKTLVHGFYQSSQVTEVSADNETDVNIINSIIDAYIAKG